MNTIELLLKPNKRPYSKAAWKQQLLVDGLDISHGYAIDYEQLCKSLCAPGDYFILTCGCGDAGCAGLYKPIKVRVESDQSHWHILQPAPERHFSFIIQEAINGILKPLKMARKIITRVRPGEAYPIGPYFFRGGELEKCIQMLENRLACNV